MASPVVNIKTAFDSVKVPTNDNTVFKDECCFSFDTPESKTGLFVCLNRFLGLGKRFVTEYSNLTGSKVFLHIKRIRKEKKDISEEPEAKKPTRLAIGLEGGFNTTETEKYEYDEELSVVVLPSWTSYSIHDLPPLASSAVDAVMKADSAAKKAEMEKLAGTWDGEMRVVSKLAKDLLQLENGTKILPSGWKCECCDVCENLWMNLTDGSIKCGRQFFDGTGGNNHALEHYQTTGYPLAVKLGTITPSGADVYSYNEDDMVQDPYLANHLAHFGIDILKMQKTDKSMLELEVELNQRSWEWSALQESEGQLHPLYGPSHTGLWNLGNSCYINSVLQVLFNCLPSFRDTYYQPNLKLSSNDDFHTPAHNFQLQIRKLAHGLLSGEYSTDPEDLSPQAIKPGMFRNLVGRGHSEFSSNKQQDVAEYILHLFALIEKHSKAGSKPTDCLKFRYEDRIECCSSRKVKYMDDRYDYILQVPINVDEAVNKDEVQEFEEKKKKLEEAGQKIDPKDHIRPRISLPTCLQKLCNTCTIDDFYSPAISARTQASKTTKLITFPDFLLIQVQKFTMGSDWLEKKLDISMEVPDHLDLTHMKGIGRQQGEEELPDAPDDHPAPQQRIDTGIVSQLMEMGFPLSGSRRAAYHTHGQGLEAATNWVMEHVEDADFYSAFELPATGTPQSIEPDIELLASLHNMGFPYDACVKALKITNNNLAGALEKIMGGMDEEEDDSTDAGKNPQPANDSYTDGVPKYSLQAFISHMGSSCKSGHYVCHILKEGRWVIYNDEKVALSEKPPRELAYMYLYKRI